MIQQQLSQMIEAGWTRSTIARNLGVDHITVERWVLGLHPPLLPQLTLQGLIILAKRSPPPRKRKPRKGGLYSSLSGEWATPPEIVDRIVAALGSIDLDPCSDGNTIPATTHYTEKDDGLTKQWAGRVYMNPPYGTGIKRWISKLADEFEQGEVTEAIALVPARTDTAWFRRLANYPVCFIRGRLRFGGMENSAPFPSAAVYLGPDSSRFREVFSDIGDVYERA